MRNPNAKCTLQAENDLQNDKRVSQCSSISSCYSFETYKYDNSFCSEYESCGNWSVDDQLFEGCILNKYCDLEYFWNGSATTFMCPDGRKKEPEQDAIIQSEMEAKPVEIKKREPDARCSLETENDTSNGNRVTKCSSLNTCYNFETYSYDNDLCS